MKRFTLAATVTALFAVAVAPAAYAVDFDGLRRESLEQNAKHEELRRGYREGVKASDKDAHYEELRRGYQEGVKAVDFDQLRRENLEKDAVDFDDLRRENLDKDAA